jgi:light-regulated signal transduction histidine kinase (bacteriophytochrome)
MYRIVLLCMLALTASPALAGNRPEDQETDRLMQILRDELAREDCLWRESLARLSDQTPDEQQKIAGLVAYVCSQKNRERIVQGATTEDLVRHEVAAYDQLWAQERAIVVGRQIRELRERRLP